MFYNILSRLQISIVNAGSESQLSDFKMDAEDIQVNERAFQNFYGRHFSSPTKHS